MRFLAFASMLAIGAVAYSADLLVGHPERSTDWLAGKTAPLGKLVAKRKDGFWVLRLKDGVTVDQAKKALKKSKVEHVFEPKVTFVNRQTYEEVREHNEFREARREMMGGTEEDEIKGKEFGGDVYDAIEHFLMLRVDKTGEMSRDDLFRGAAQRDALPPATMGGFGTAAVGGGWQFMGPRSAGTPYSQYMTNGPVSGRKNSIAFAPSSPAIVFAASAGGGIWKSTNGGTNWAPLSDKWSYLQTSCVAVKPNNANVVLAGTGDYESFFQRYTNGIMRSTDGGTTWTNVDQVQMRYEVVNRIVFLPSNPEIVIAATGKGSGGTKGGIYRSTNAGLSWTRLNVPDWDYDDLEVGTTGHFYAVGTDGQSAGAILKSTNLGVTWTETVNPATNNQAAMEVAVSKVNANTLYLLATGDEKIYKSTTGGTSWTDITTNFPTTSGQNPANYNWSQKDYDYHLNTGKDGTVDLLFCGLITVARNRGGVANGWVDIGRSYEENPPNNIHSDQHSFAMNPTNPNVMIFGCDGGLWRYTYNPTNQSGTWTPLNSSFGDHQFYGIGTFGGNETHFMGGAQDNFTSASRGNVNAWAGIGAGDGGWCAFDQSNNGRHFVTNQNMGIFNYTSLTDGTGDYIRHQIPNYPGSFIGPYIYAGTGSQIYGAGNTLLRWTGSGNSWTNFNEQLANEYVLVLAAAPSNKNTIYSGGKGGEICVTFNGGTTNKLVGFDDNFRPVGGIAVSYTNNKDILIGYQGPVNSGPRLMRCTDTSLGLPTFTDVSGGQAARLPDVPINAVARDPYDARIWYVGTDVGVFMTTNSGSSWTNMNVLGLPNVQVNDLEVNAQKTYLYAGTFGRGIWRIPLGSSISPYLISGTVRNAANNPLPGATVTLQRYRNVATAKQNNPNANIPDNNTTGITSVINIPTGGIITKVQATVVATHDDASDLEVTLFAPDGNGVYLWNRSFGFGLNYYWDLYDFKGKSPTGNWTLRVKDLNPGTVGQLNTFKLIVYYDGYAVERTVTSAANGTYSFTNLPAGQYQVKTTMTGRTFTPGFWRPIIGPSSTGRDFKSNN